jgi:SPP1 family holin
MMKKQAIIRLVVLVILLLNQFLVSFGWSPIPFSEELIFEAVSNVATVTIAVYVWWKNNSITKEAQEADLYLKKLKGK